jgi:hypothetical protein
MPARAWLGVVTIAIAFALVACGGPARPEVPSAPTVAGAKAAPAKRGPRDGICPATNAFVGTAYAP